MALSKITTNSLAANAVTSAAIANGEIALVDLASQAVGTDQIATGAITGDKLGLTAVNANNIVDATITGDKISANLSLTGTVEVKGTSTQSGEIKIYEDSDNGTNFVSLKSPDSISTNVNFILPSTDGTSGQAIVTNGSGVLSFATTAQTKQNANIVSANTTAVPGGYYVITQPMTLTLPASPEVGAFVGFTNRSGNTTHVFIGQNSSNVANIMFANSNLLLDSTSAKALLVYSNTAYGWVIF